VIPVYDVERYLALCLQSVCAQNYPNLDVILVNDGSTDNSLAVARKFQEKLNLHIVDQENSGLSAARNAGVRAIEETDYLMFLDSDDALAPEALKNLVSSIVDTGADFVVGDTTRMKGVTRLKRRDTRPVFDRASFAKQSAGSLASTTLKEHPQAILDVTAWNRLFDFTFYRQNKFSFPEGMFFEDMALMTKAYIRAKKFSVLSQTVYLWRVRTEGAKSITQQTNDEKKLADRITALRQMQGLIKAGIVMGKTNENNLEVFKNRVWNHDIPLYKHVPGSRALFDGLLK
jgi:CDP-glycerol glycerophosphotransferase